MPSGGEARVLSGMPNPNLSRRSALPLLACAALVLAACEPEADPVGPDAPRITEPALNEIVTTASLNASSADSLVYFSLTEGRLVPATADWDLALRRFELRLRSPAIAGPASRTVSGVGLANTAALTDAQILALTPTSTRAAFDSLRAAAIPADSLFQSDRLAENRQGHLNLGGVPTANAAAFWKTRLADGRFAVFRVARIRFTPQFAVDSLVIESRVQAGATLGPVQQLAIAPGGQVRALSLATNTVAATATGCGWDLQFNPVPSQLSLTMNTACGVGTYPGGTSPTFATVTSASDAPQYAGFLSQLVGPIPTSVLDKAGPFRYNLTGTDRLHPTFNTFLVKTGARVYKLQVIDYYSATGAAGFPTLRYARIR